MKNYFLKKYIFAVAFLVCLFAFSAANIALNSSQLLDLKDKLLAVKSVDEVKAVIKEAEASAAEDILFRMKFIEGYGYTQKLMGKREFNNFSFVRDEDGMIYYGALTTFEVPDMPEYVARVRRMKECVEQKGQKFLLVLPPSKVLSGVSQVPPSWPINDPNEAMDRFLHLLQQNGVATIDLRFAMQQSQEPLDELFFKTDHHWTPKAAFYGSAEIVKAIKEKYNDDWDPEGFYTDIDNYNSYKYSQCMLGSNGRNAGAVFSGLDDFEFLWPKFETDFTWSDYAHDKESRGQFSDSLLDVEELTASGDIYSARANAIYLHEVTSRDKITNHLNPDGPSVTVLRDSYFSPVACFLAPMCSQIDMAWGRSTRNDMDFEKYVKDSDSDYVILEIYPYNIDEESFNFFVE